MNYLICNYSITAFFTFKSLFVFVV